MDKRWWRVFNDGKLNSLISDLESGNFDLRAAEARRNQAYASLGLDRSQLFPQPVGNASVMRNRDSESNPDGGMGAKTYFTEYRVGMSLAYEIDLWGRVRRLIEAGQASTEAAEAAADQVKLSLQAQLARSYFALRFLDSEAAVMEQELGTRQETLDLENNRLEGGKSSELDVARAKSELAATRAQLVGLQAPRAALENAIAVLAGKNASNFSIKPAAITGAPPSVPAGSPAQLLGRRPDVFAAERMLAQSSAEVGVAAAEFYPRVSLIGSGGLSAIDSSDFLKWSSGEFSIGPEVELPLLQGQKRKATHDLAKAKHEEALADYQQTVLTAFADVENALSSRRAANNEVAAWNDSVNAARKSFELSNERYKQGASSYLEVMESRRELLDARRDEVQARGRAYEATVMLIQALGGGFR